MEGEKIGENLKKNGKTIKNLKHGNEQKKTENSIKLGI